MPTPTAAPSRPRAAGRARRGSLAGRLLAAAAALTAVHAGAPGPAFAQPPPCPDNRLANPGFEAGFGARGRMTEVVANGWTPWYATLPGIDGLNYPPVFAPAARHGPGGALDVAEGVWSQQLGTEHATHTGGLWQTVAVPSGSLVHVSAWAYAWASRGDDPRRSEPAGTYVLDVGLDPQGRGDPFAEGIAWTDPITVTDVWVPLALEAAVDGPAATLVLRGRPLQIVAHNVSRWDGACLRVAGAVGVPTDTPTPAPRPTRAPATLAPGAPTHTPNVATVAAMAAAFEAATARAADLATKAAAAEPPAAPGRVFRGLPDATAAPTTADFADTPPAGPTPADRLMDHIGLFALSLAALVGGLLIGLGRHP